MGRKKRTVVALKPFCYYCDKEFNNEIILHQHQKARHFNCKICGKRFSTAPALDTHMFQVHKEKLKSVPNAKAGRDTFDISIYGMDGVPIDLLNYRLAEKVAIKKRKLIRENKLIADEEDLKEERARKKKGKKELNMSEILKKGAGFYHNPDSINLTLNPNQMSSMYNSSMIVNNSQMLANQYSQITDHMYVQHGMQQMNPISMNHPMGGMNMMNMNLMNISMNMMVMQNNMMNNNNNNGEGNNITGIGENN
jgi:hypothetical protein